MQLSHKDLVQLDVPRGCREGRSQEKGMAPTRTDEGLSMKSEGSH